MPKKSKPVEFVVDENGCHICTSHRVNSDGYPAVKRLDRMRPLHRLVYELAFGEIGSDVVVRHKCDNRKCVNLDHLIPGSHADNTADRVARNRSACGESHGQSKLTVGQVLAIRSSRQSITGLAREYGVSRALVYLVLDRVIWKHVP